VPAVVKGRTRCFSYHDGNLAQMINSPYSPVKIPDKIIRQALEYEREVYLGMDKIFTMSEYLRQSFINDFSVPTNKVVCIGAGINLKKFPPAIIKDYRKKNILFIGIDFIRKGGFVLLEAFKLVRKKIPSAKLHIIGPKKSAVDPKYPSGVICHGFLSRNNSFHVEKFDEIVRDSSLFVMPSLYEPFGIAPLEAMANQIPCIVTNNWAFPEMVKPGVNGDLVKCGSVEDLAEKIIYYLEHGEMLQKMGERARAIVWKDFSWNKVVQRLKKEISNI